MSIYYTYLLKHIPTNTFYYGVRFAEGSHPDEFWKTYFTSSKKKIPELREQYGDGSFEFEIRKIFTCKQKAINWESKVLRRMKVIENSEIWLNKTSNKAFSKEVAFKWTGVKRPVHADIMRKHFLNGKNPNPKGSIQPTKVREKISKSLMGNTHKLGKKENAETIAKKRLMHKGKRDINNGIIGKRIMQTDPLPEGFVYGRLKRRNNYGG